MPKAVPSTDETLFLLSVIANSGKLNTDFDKVATECGMTSAKAAYHKLWRTRKAYEGAESSASSTPKKAQKSTPSGKGSGKKRSLEDAQDDEESPMVKKHVKSAKEEKVKEAKEEDVKVEGDDDGFDLI